MVEDLKDAITKINDILDQDLYDKTRGQLEDNWLFKWRDSVSLEKNPYEFFDMLELYKYFCSQWEEEKNGHVCIVGRVRDKYVMPKIKELVKDIKKRNKNVL